MQSPYGVHRVIGEDGLLPQPAQRLDAGPPCGSLEMQIAVERLHVDASSLRQLRLACGGDLAAVRAELLSLVQRRGKLHNPVTNSGGMLIGSVSAVGPDYPDPPPRGTRVATLASLTLTPLRLEDLGAVDAHSNAIAARGVAYLFARSPWVALPSDIPESVLLAALDVAGAPARVRLRCRPGMRVLIVGAGNSGALSALAALEAGVDEVLVTDISQSRLERIGALGLAGLQVRQADASNALEFAALAGAPADLTVSCVDRAGVEMACILATRSEGHVLFFSMTTDFARAALGAEGVGSGAALEIGNGYLPGHATMTIDLLRRHPDAWDLLVR